MLLDEDGEVGGVAGVMEERWNFALKVARVVDPGNWGFFQVMLERLNNWRAQNYAGERERERERERESQKCDILTIQIGSRVKTLTRVREC